MERDNDIDTSSTSKQAEEELRQNIEEMHATQEDVERANKELKKNEEILKKQAEELAKEKYLMDALMDSVPEYIYFKDKDSKFYIDFGRRNIEFLFVKNMQGRLFAKYFLSHYLYESALFLFFIFSGKGMAFLKAKIQFLVNLGYLLQERKKLKHSLIKSNKFKDIYKVEQYFFRSRWRGLADKIRKAIRSYKTYMNLN